MDNYEYNEMLKSLQIKMENIENIVKPEEIKKELKEIEKLEQNPDFWSDTEKAINYLRKKEDWREHIKNIKMQKMHLMMQQSIELE